MTQTAEGRGRRRFPARVAGAAAALATLSLLAVGPVCAAPSANYLYNLSTFTGPLALSSVKVTVDEDTGEAYVPYAGQGVAIFNESGMEVYRFGDDDRLGSTIVDVGALPDGTVLLLSYFPGDPASDDERRPRESPARASRWRLVHCDYRGEPLGAVELAGLPTGFENFRPNRMVLRNGAVYLVSYSEMKAVRARTDGQVEKTFDFAPLAEIDPAKVADQGLGGFAVGSDASLFVSLPIAGRLLRVSAGGAVDAFGVRGSGPGKLGVPKGIGTDARGNVYVVDILRAKVLTFDVNLQFVHEFGSLRAPENIAVTHGGKIFVSQNGNQGIAVYQISPN